MQTALKTSVLHRLIARFLRAHSLSHCPREGGVPGTPMGEMGWPCPVSARVTVQSCTDSSDPTPSAVHPYA